MDSTIRNLDPKAYRALKARAAVLGKTVGETINEAIRIYPSRPESRPRDGSLRDLSPEAYPPGNERLSEEDRRRGLRKRAALSVRHARDRPRL